MIQLWTPGILLAPSGEIAAGVFGRYASEPVVGGKTSAALASRSRIAAK